MTQKVTIWHAQTMNIATTSASAGKAASCPATDHLAQFSTQAREFASALVRLDVKGKTPGIRTQVSGRIHTAVHAPDSPDPQVCPVRAEGARLLDPARALLFGPHTMRGVRA